MKMSKILAIAALSIGMMASAAQAETFQVATGDSKGQSVYSQTFREFAAVCGREASLVEVETNGSVTNVNMLVSNKVNGAFVQSDLLAFRKLTDPKSVANIKTVFALYPEELHFLARGDVKKEGGFFGIGGKEVTFDAVDDLLNRQVGAVGGSITSGKVVSSQSGLNFQMVEFPNNDALFDALQTGKIDSILVVGGAPHKLVETLDQRFKLLRFSDDLQKRLSAIYTPTVVSYENLRQTGVPTVSTEAVFVSRTYRSQEVLTKLTNLRSCFVANLGKIQDTRNTHEKWQAIDAANKGKWEWYTLP